MRRITFQGQDFILTDGGAITTEANYRAGRASYAHLYEDGRILRHGVEIGRREDIVMGEACELAPEYFGDALLNLFTDPSWTRAWRRLL